MRSPLLRGFQLVCVAVAGGLWAANEVGARLGRQSPLLFTLSVLGEREREDGSWEGVDLLREPAARVDRFQLSLRPEQDTHAYLDALEPDGRVQRLFPALSESALLRARRVYALPAPRAFYELSGQVRLRLTVSPARAPQGAAGRVRDLGGLRERRYALSDGALQAVVEKLFESAGAGTLEVDVGAPAPAR